MLKNILFLILGISLISSSHSQIQVSLDYRSTAIANALMDNYQTYEFRGRGWPERNPLMAWFVNNNPRETVLIAGLASTWAIDRIIQNQPKKKQNTYYAIWSAMHIAAIVYNISRDSPGFPIIIPVIKVKF